MAEVGLFDKKYCDICATKIGFFGNRKLADGNMCKECAALLSPNLVGRKEFTVAEMKEHLTKTPAMHFGIIGEVIFENEKGIKETIGAGDYVEIEANVKHWLLAITDCNLILVK